MLIGLSSGPGLHIDRNRLGTGGKLDLVLPFINMKKAEVMQLGKELGVPFELTWSCYLNSEEPCGHCVGCVGRANAFSLIGEKDPLAKE